MANKLTKKQRGFVKDYVKTGIGTVAVRNHYDVANDNVAKSIASENLTKPYIQKAIAEMLPDDLLGERHLELLNKRETVIGLKREDGTYDRIDIGPDVQGVSKGLDMAYKLKGSYAPEKSTSVNLNLEVKPEDKDLEAIRLRFEEELKQKLIQ